MSLCFAESLDIAIECAMVRAEWSVGVIVESGEVHSASGAFSAVNNVKSILSGVGNGIFNALMVAVSLTMVWCSLEMLNLLERIGSRYRATRWCMTEH